MAARAAPERERRIGSSFDAALLTWRGKTLLALVLALGLALPSLGVGLVLDDHVLELFIRAHLTFGGPGALDLFHVYGRGGAAEIARQIELGVLPWWTSPELSITLFRPLAVASHYLDFWAWPSSPWLMHAQNLFWYACLLALVAVLYRRWLGSGTVATLALFLYAFDDAHAEGVAWIAGRNTVLTALFVVAALLAYDRARRDAWRPGRVLAPLALLCGFASGEGALAAWAYLVPHALFLDRGSLRARALGLLPLFGLSAGWLTLYHALGYGTHGSGIYCDPLDAPWYFWTRRVPAVYPEVLRELFALPRFGLERFAFLRGAFCSLFAAGVVALSALLLLARARTEPTLRFWIAALLASVLPLCTITVAPRLLFLSSIAAFALIAELVVGMVRAARAGSRWKGVLAVVVVGYQLALHVVLAALLGPQAQDTLTGYEQVIRSSAGHVPARGDADTAYVLNTPNHFITSLAPSYAPPGTWPPRMYILGASTAAIRLSRPERDAIVLEPRGGYLRELTSQVLRSPASAFAPGQALELGAMRVTVESVTADGRPARVRFRAQELTRQRNLWLAWHGDRYQLVRLPAIGASVWLPGS